MKIKQIILLLLFVGSYLLLEGCANAPEELGIAPQEWNNYEDAKQEQLLKANQQILAKQQKLQENSTATQNDQEFLQIQIAGGTALMPPDFAYVKEYHPIFFQIYPESCKDVWLLERDGDAKTKLTSCYQNKILFLDASHNDLQKAYGSVSFHYNPLWENSFTYDNVNSSGYVRLQKARVTITANEK